MAHDPPTGVAAPPLSSVAREPSGGCWPGWYLPVSTPCAMGLQTIWLTPSSSQVGTTSPSMTRHSMEYCGWLEMSWKPSSLERLTPSRICTCLLYTSDAADEEDSVDLGGRRIIK